MQLTRSETRLRFDVTTREGDGDACVEVARDIEPRSTSLFGTEQEATDFLLGMDFSVDVVGGRVRMQPIEHTPWQPRFTHVTRARFAYLQTLQRLLGVGLTFDSALLTSDVQQVWRAARWI